MNDILFSPISISELESLVERTMLKVLDTHNPSKESKEDELLTVAGAAAFLSLSIPTIYSMISKREIPFLKPEGTKRVYFLKEDLRNYIKDGRQKTKSQILDEVKNKQLTHKKRSKT
jgi:excisionase family DNA binding protein